MESKLNQIIIKYTPFFIISMFVILIISILFFIPNNNENIKNIDDEYNITFSKNEISLNYGESINLYNYLEYDKDYNLIWESNNSEFVSVDQNGIINIINDKNGFAIITVRTIDNKKSDSIRINVISNKEENTNNKEEINLDKDNNNNDNIDDNRIINVTEISFDKNEINLNYGEAIKLNVNVSPSNASNKTIKWSSSDSSFVSVDQNGSLKILKNINGNVVITAQSIDGNFKDTLNVNIKRKEIKVDGISLNKSTDRILLNSSNLTTTLKANISPSNADNKNVIWSSSNPDIASVKDGIVTAHKLGSTTITVKTEDGSFMANTKISVEKNVIIVIGASQVTRMNEVKKSYTYLNNKYTTSDNTLIYIHDSGSKIIFQTSTGFNTAMSKIENIASNNKAYINFYIFFPLVGNTIKDFECTNINTSNNKINNYVINYNNSIKKVIDGGYNAKGYVVSMHPVVVSQTTNPMVVVNENKNSCSINYRSNRKYNYFNKAISSIISNGDYDYIKYLDTFNQIMKVDNIDKNYSYKITYKTKDGVHWNDETTNTYVDMMLNLSGDL